MTYTRDLRLTGRDDEMTILFIYLSIYIFCDDMVDDELAVSSPGELNQGWLVGGRVKLGTVQSCYLLVDQVISKFMSGSRSDVPEHGFSGRLNSMNRFFFSFRPQ